MKKLMLSQLLLLTIFFTTKGQGVYLSEDSMINSPNPGRYYLNVLQPEAQLTEADSIEGDEKHMNAKAYTFWKDRMPGGNNVDSPFYKYSHMMRYYTESTCLPKVGDFNGNWENTGPKTQSQSQGRVYDVYAKPVPYPNLPTEIWIGTGNAGLWKTTNGGTNWTNVSDSWNPTINGAGIPAIAVNPFNANEMYVATMVQGGDRRNYMTWEYGQGVWHSLDGGATWNIDLNGINNFQAMDHMKYCPHQLNGGTTEMIIATHANRVYRKIGAGNWADITPASLIATPLPIREITFGPAGKFYISTQLNYVGNPPIYAAPNIYEFNYNTTTGAIGPTPIILNSTNWGNGFAFSGVSSANSLAFETGYAGNNKLYIMVVADNFGAATEGHHSLYSYNISTATLTLEYALPYCNPSCRSLWRTSVEVSPTNPNVVYVDGVRPQRLWKDANGWHQDEYPNTGGAFHDDNLRTHIYHSDPNGNFNNDIVYWGNDAGLTRTIGNAMANLNGDLITNEVYDVDVSQLGKRRAAASFDNGLHAQNTNNTWDFNQNGDGFSAIYDKRFDQIDVTLLYQGNSSWFWHTHGNSLGGQNTFGQFPRRNAPGTIDVPRAFEFPHEFDEGFMYGGNKNLLKSMNNGYGFNWDIMTTGGALDGTAFTIKDNCRAFAVSKDLGNGPIDQRMYYGLVRPLPDALGNYHIFYAQKTNGDWVERTPTLIKNGSFNLTDIVIDDKDPKRVFISMGMVHWTMPVTGQDRVYKGEFNPISGFMTWSDMSTGLPQLPITCLAYQAGSDDIIYAGTDAGVYRWDKPQGCWVKFDGTPSGDKMPGVVVHDLVIDYCNRKLVMGSYSRGVWETDLYEPSVIPGNTDEINTNTTWGNTTGITTKYIKGSVLVKAPATLTILGTPSMSSNTSTTTIYMPKYGEIRVEPGAKLIVNGAHITNDCIKNWHGIYAYGNGSQPQIITGGLDPNHGIVDMTDAIIENAEDAVNNFGGSSNPNTGGILKATRTKFLNNIRSVAMLKYNNVISGVLQPDLSLFQFCTFEVNNAIKDPFLRHVTLWGVRGVSFEQNNFLNNTGSNVHHREAVYTIDASYTMNSNTFDGFYKGIESSQFSYSTGNLLPIHIGDNEFNANEIAIHLKAMNYPLVRGNTINIGMKQTPIDPGQTAYFSLGAKMESVSRFLYTKNYHNMSYQPVGGLFQYTAGTEVYNTGDNEENINENYYNDLLIGNDAAFQCANAAGSAGLNYKCNVNTDNLKYDFIIQGNAPRVRNIQWGGVVGGQIRPTGNVLSQNASVASWHHVLGGNAPVTYLYNIQFPNEFLNGNSSNVSPLGMASSAFCAMSFAVSDELNTMLENSEYNLVSTTQLDTIKNLYELANTEYTQLNTLYNQLLDNGNTDSLVEEIQNFTVAEQLETREQFLAMSPYVTTESLRELAEQGTVSNPILFEILLANPEGSQNEDLINYIMLEKSNPLPLYMINLIRLSWQGTSARKELFNSISSASSIRSMVANQIVNIYQLSSTLANQDSFAVWIGRDLTLRNSYTFIDYLLYKGNRSEASAKLNALPLQFPFSAQDSIEYTAFTALYNFKKGLLDDTLEINQLDSVRLQTLVAIANSSDYSMARTMAQSALCFFYNICYPEPERELPQVASRPIGKLQSSPENNLITAYPNPSQDFIAFQYNLPIGAEAIRLDIVDAVGRNVYNTVLKGHVGQHIWDVRQMKDGIYIYNVTTKSGEKYSGKVTVKK